MVSMLKKILSFSKGCYTDPVIKPLKYVGVFIFVTDALEKIRKLHTDFLKDEERVKKARNKIDASRQTRLDTKKELAKCQLRPLDVLEKKVKGLSVAKLNEEVR